MVLLANFPLHDNKPNQKEQMIIREYRDWLYIIEIKYLVDWFHQTKACELVFSFAAAFSDAFSFFSSLKFFTLTLYSFIPHQNIF